MLMPILLAVYLVTRKQAAAHLKTLGILRRDWRENFSKQMLIGFDPSTQVFVHGFPAGKNFVFLPGDFCLLAYPRGIGIYAPTQ